MDNPEQYLNDLNEAIDDAHERISKLESKARTQSLAIMGVAVLGAGSAFLSFKTASAVRDLVKGIEPMGAAVQALIAERRQAAQSPAQNSSMSDMPPPAEGPATEAPEWVREANSTSSARHAMEQADIEWGNEN